MLQIQKQYMIFSRNIDNSKNYSKIGGSVAYAISLLLRRNLLQALMDVPLFAMLKPVGDIDSLTL